MADETVLEVVTPPVDAAPEPVVTPPEPTVFDAPELPLPDVNKDALAAVEASLKKPEPEPEPEVETPVAEAKPVEPEVKPPEPEVKRPSDEFGDLPENTNVKTKERFETMRTKYDELHKSFETTKADLEDQVERSVRWADTIKSTGTNPEQFGLLMQYAKAVNSGTPEGLQEAYEMMQEGLKVLAKQLGKEAPGFDPLDDYPDLKAEFDDGGLTRERANELAQARSASKLHATTTQQTTQQQAYNTARENALNGLVAVGNRLRVDPHYAAKSKLLEVITETVLKSEVDPAKWPDLIESAYRKLPNPAPTVAATIIPSAPVPIRPGINAGGGVDKVAGSVLEAVEASLRARG